MPAELAQVRYVTLLGATGAIRTATHDGRDWTVVPVVALVEGVIHAVNAPQPELVRSGLFHRKLAQWESKPVFAGHPMKNGVPVDGLLPDVIASSFGVVRNASSDRSLRMEAWLDHAKCLDGTPGGRVLERVQSVPPKPLEVSVGVWVHAKAGDGQWLNGKRYAAEWLDWEPNHLALLDDGKMGACSVDMGCGTHRIAMRVAASGDLELDREEDATPMTFKERFTTFFRSLMPRGWGDDEVKQELRDALDLVEPLLRTGGGEIVRVKNDAVIYCLYPPSNYYDAPMGPASKMTYWSRGYTFDTATQMFLVDAERTQVEPTTHYEPYRAAGDVQDVPEPTPKAPCACGHLAAAAAGEVTMERKDRIAALVANPHSPVKSLKMLEAATDDELGGIEATAGAIKAAAEKAVTDAAALKTANEATEKARQDLKVATDALAAPVAEDRLPQNIRDLVAREAAREAAEKTALVDTLKAAAAGSFTEDELRAKPIEELKKLATLMKATIPAPAVDFSLIGMPRVAAAGDLASYAPPDSYKDSLAAAK